MQPPADALGHEAPFVDGNVEGADVDETSAARPGTTPTFAQSVSRWAHAKQANLYVWLVFVIATLGRGTGGFYHDALNYWKSTPLQSPEELPDWYGTLRGVWTTIVYLPASLAANAIGQSSGEGLVLLQNAVCLGAVAAFLLPAVLQHLRVVRTSTIALAAALFWILTSGFAPYPLVDAYAMIGVFLAVHLAVPTDPRSRLATVARLLGFGATLGVIVNLRPAYLITAAALVVVSTFWNRIGTAWVIAGGFAALLPQAIYNYVQLDAWSFTPTETRTLAALQAGLASYVVRYDTVIDSAHPMLTQCSPDMVAAMAGSLPGGTVQLLMTFAVNLPQSALFAIEKLGGSVHWPFAAPYGNSTPFLDDIWAWAVTAITAIGIVALFFYRVDLRRSLAASGRRAWLLLMVVAGGTVVTIVGSQTETRFALPLAVVGVLGCGLIGASRELGLRPARIWVVGVVVTACLLALASIGLSHVVVDEISPEACTASE